MSIFGVFLIITIMLTLLLVTLLLLFRFNVSNIWPMKCKWFKRFAKKLNIERQKNKPNIGHFIEQIWPISALRNLSLRKRTPPSIQAKITGKRGTLDEIIIQSSSLTSPPLGHKLITKSIKPKSIPPTITTSPTPTTTITTIPAAAAAKTTRTSITANTIDDDFSETETKSLSQSEGEFSSSNINSSLQSSCQLTSSSSSSSSTSSSSPSKMGRIKIQIKVPQQMKRKKSEIRSPRKTTRSPILKFSSKLVKLKTSVDVGPLRLLSTTPEPSSPINLKRR